MSRKLNPLFLSGVDLTVRKQDKTLDSIIRPLIDKHGINPLKELIPVDKELSESEAINYLNTILDKYSGILKDDQSPIPLVVGLLLFLAGSVGTPIISALSSNLTDKGINQNLKKGIRPSLLDPSSAIRYLFRNPEYADRCMETLRRLGFTELDIKALLSINESIPSATDVISFAVREVYDPEIVKKFGQMEGFEKFWKHGEKDVLATGMSRISAEKYWAAHWILPAVGQGFEMLHRGVIDDKTLDMLFIALDIMPGWKEQLKKLSYSLYTRVDVRRMHKLGILDREAVKKAYQEQGYDPEKAENMTLFTERYNADTPEEEMTDEERRAKHLKDLTKSDVLRLFRKELVERIDAGSMLYWIGYDDFEVNTLLDREEYLREEEKIDMLIRMYHDAFIKGVWDLTELVVKMGSLNLPSHYQNFLIELWQLEMTVKISRPSKSEILSFLKHDIIKEDVAREELKKQMYPDKYVDWYIQTVKPKEKLA